jgi:hypothetical protein
MPKWLTPVASARQPMREIPLQIRCRCSGGVL